MKYTYIMDDLDKRIIEDLNADARMPFRQIADKEGISIGTVHNRIKKLKTDGVLKGFCTLIDHSKLGYNISAIIFIKVNGGELDKVKQEILKLNEINLFYQISGIYDLIVITRFKDMIDLSSFIKKISSFTNMKAESNVILEILKDDYLKINI